MTTNKDNQDAQGSQEIQLQDYPVTICNACINLVGNMCYTPGCAFIRCTMNEVKEFLNQTQICPLVNGEKIYTIDPIPQPSKKDHGEEVDILESWENREKDKRGHILFNNPFRENNIESLGQHKSIYFEKLLHATDQKARRETEEQCAEKLKYLLEENLATEEYFGVYGEVNLKQFIEDFKNS